MPSIFNENSPSPGDGSRMRQLSVDVFRASRNGSISGSQPPQQTTSATPDVRQDGPSPCSTTPSLSPELQSPSSKDPTLVSYEQELEILNSKLQKKWSTVMEEGPCSSTTSYKKVHVLLISWAKEFDDMGVQDEVKDLGDVFRNDFNFNVRTVELQNDKPQLHMNLHVAQFALDYGKPKTLLIIYFAGHGSRDPTNKELKWAGKSQMVETGRNSISWRRTEGNLMDIESDILEIFDCCYAGDLGDPYRGDRPRRFEYLAACAAGSTTKAPGERSFTRALIWALKSLKERKFTTVDLCTEIKKAPNFPKTQEPKLSKRGDEDCGELIEIQPLDEKVHRPHAQSVPSDASLQQPKPPHSILSLRFVFDEVPTEDAVKVIGETLNYVIKEKRLPVRRIMWGGLSKWGSVSGWRVSLTVQRAAVKLKKMAARRASRDERRDPGGKFIQKDELEKTVKEAVHNELVEHEQEKLSTIRRVVKFLAIVVAVCFWLPVRIKALAGLHGLVLFVGVIFGMWSVWAL